MLLKVKGKDQIELIQELVNIVNEVSFREFDSDLRLNGVPYASKGGVRFTLRAASCRGLAARRVASGKRSVNASWEAHKCVMEALFDKWPDAVLVTALATYRGQADFEARHPDTWHHNAGSQMMPVCFGDL